MIRLFVTFVLIYISRTAYGFDYSSNLQSDSGARDLTAISDLFPPAKDMACVSKCAGPNGCDQFKQADSCAEDGFELDCSWICH